jgi:hypothetical protein
MATPHVAGVAALILAVAPNTPAGQVGNILRSTARALRDNPTDPVPNDQYGHGLVQAAAAVAAVAPQQAEAAVVAPALPRSIVVLCPSQQISCQPSTPVTCPTSQIVICPSQQISCQPSTRVTCFPSQIVICRSLQISCQPSTPVLCRRSQVIICRSLQISCQPSVVCPSLPPACVVPSALACPSLAGCPSVACGNNPALGAGAAAFEAYDPYGYDPYGSDY